MVSLFPSNGHELYSTREEEEIKISCIKERGKEGSLLKIPSFLILEAWKDEVESVNGEKKWRRLVLGEKKKSGQNERKDEDLEIF